MKRITLLFITLLLWTSAKAQSPVNSVGSGCALKFDGAGNGQWVEIPDDDPLSGGHDLTIEAWIKLTSLGSPNSGIVMKYYDTRDKDYGVFVDNNRFVVFGYELGENNPPAIRSNSQIQLNKWYHIAVTFDDITNTVSIYINGVKDRQQNTISELPNTPASVKVGKMFSLYYSPGNAGGIYYNACNFTGDIDEVRIWNYARTETEIRRDMCRRLTGTEPGLVGYWRFDDCGGNVALDSSPNGNHGTLY